MRKTFYLRDGKKRFWRLCKFIFLGVLIVVGRLVWIQLVHGSDMAELSISQTMGINIVSSPRGAIVDRDGEELAVSIMSKSLYADPVAMEDHPESDAAKSGRNVKRLAADLLAAPLGISAESLYSDFTIEGARFVWIKRTLSPEMAEKVQLIIKENNLPGLHFLEESKRYYTKGTMAAQVLGFVGTDDVGLSGIELAMDSIIKTRSKEMQETTDAVGNPIGESSMEDMRPQNMPTVYLTIDSKIQFVLEDALDRAMKETKSRAAAAILMDPHTGAVLGMASRPTFDPNDFGEYPVSTWTNRAISIIYEPGSVFKPIVGCMGLSENIITPQTVFEDKGSIKIADRVISNWDGEGRGQVPFEDIIKYSINTGMVQLGMQLGANQMIDYSKKFGFGQPTGIELPGEESGILYRPEDMYEPDIATMAIGQGIAVTPLQMLRAICAIANGGELLEPYIIDKIVMPDGRVLRQGQKKIVRRVITEDVAGQMRMMMEKVVSEGGGKPAHIAGYQIAGKTGTAEKLAEQGGYAPGEYIASFVGFVPAANPQYAMLVMLDTPQGAFYGSQVSAPVFKDTLQQILVAKGIQPSTHEGLPSFEEDAKDRAKAVKVPVMEFLPDNKVKIPDFTGLDMRQTAELVQRGHLVLVPYGSGRAKKQSLAPGTVAAEGTKLEIWFE